MKVPPCSIFDFETPFACPTRQIGQPARNASHPQLIGLADHRHNQPCLDGGGHANVHLIPLCDLPILVCGVDPWVLAQRPGAGLDGSVVRVTHGWP